MKIGYFADGPWSHQALELLISDPEIEIQFIVPRFDTQDPVLKNWAQKLRIPFIPYENVNAIDFHNLIKKFNSDLFISMSFNQILKPELISIPRKGFINCHAGNLPYYRGRNPLNWVLINDEKEFGITVHYVDEGIDTGNIVLQKQYPIADDDDYGTLLDKAISECPLVLFEAVKRIKKELVQPIVQSDIHPIGTYFGRRKDGDEKISFEWEARRLFNFIRAISLPGPGARCHVNGYEIAFLKSKLIENAPNYIATLGEVVGRNEQGNIVKVGDSTLLITEYSYIRNRALCEITRPNFPIGTRFS